MNTNLESITERINEALRKNGIKYDQEKLKVYAKKIYLPLCKNKEINDFTHSIDRSKLVESLIDFDFGYATYEQVQQLIEEDPNLEQIRKLSRCAFDHAKAQKLRGKKLDTKTAKSLNAQITEASKKVKSFNKSIMNELVSEAQLDLNYAIKKNKFMSNRLNQVTK